MVFLTLLVIAVGVLSLLAMGLVGLFEASWQVLLFMLISTLGVLQWLSAQSQASNSPSPPKVSTSATAQTHNYSLSKVRGEDLLGFWLQLRSANWLPGTATQTPTSPQASPTTASQDDTTASTELVYRGIHYQLQTPPEPAPQEPPEAVVEGTYRGHHWERSLTHPTIATDHSDEITYRGCKVRKTGGREEGRGEAERKVGDEGMRG